MDRRGFGLLSLGAAAAGTPVPVMLAPAMAQELGPATQYRAIAA